MHVLLAGYGYTIFHWRRRAKVQPAWRSGGTSFVSMGTLSRLPMLVLWGGEFNTTQAVAQDLATAAQGKSFEVEMKSLAEARRIRKSTPICY